MLSTVLALVVAGLLAAALPAQARYGEALGFSPHWDWRRLETPHFEIVFPAELEPLARKSAAYLEEAHAAIAGPLQWEPRRTHVILADNTDAANGLAAAAERFGIILLTTPPENWFSTSRYDSWLRLVATHEYAHILNMDPTRGPWSVARVLFGDVALPNSLWPSWMVEGLAVYFETRFTGAGRGRSPTWDAIARVQARDGLLGPDALGEPVRPESVTLDRVQGEHPPFPSGETPYLYGYFLMRELAFEASREGRASLTADGQSPLAAPEAALGELSARSSRRVPYLVDGNAENVSGRSWPALWDSFVRRAHIRAGKALARVRKDPVTEPSAVVGTPSDLDDARAPAYSPDGRWLAFTGETPHRRSGLYLIDRQAPPGAPEAERTRRLGDQSLGGQASFTPDSRFVISSALRRADRYQLASDLIAAEPATGEVRQLTEGLRTRDPDVSPDGRTIAFVHVQHGKTTLATASLEGDSLATLRVGPLRELHSPEGLGAVSNPRFSPDGGVIVFSQHPDGASREDLMWIPADGAAPASSLISDGHYHRYPAFDRAQGRLCWISDRTGIENLWCGGWGPAPISAPADAWLASNVEGALAFPVFDPARPGELAAASLSGYGWGLETLTAAPAGRLDAKAVTIPPPDFPAPAAAPAQAPELPRPWVPDAGFAAPAGPYSAWNTLPPRWWFPYAWYSGHSLYLAGQVYGYDATDRHRYGASLGIDTLVGRPDWSLAYSNRSLGPTFTASGSDTTGDVLTGADGRLDSYTRSTRYGLSASYAFPETYSVLVPSLTFQVARDLEFKRPALGSGLQLRAASRNVPILDAAVGWSNAESSRLALGPERGFSLSGGVRRYFNPGQESVKGLVLAESHWPLGGLAASAAATVSLKAAWSSASPLSSYSKAPVKLATRSAGSLDGLPSDGFEQLLLRGYPGSTFLTRAAAVPAASARAPLWNVYRGWGTAPFFVERLWAEAFAESAIVARLGGGLLALPSAGAGARLQGTLFIHLPWSLAVDYHHGFRSDYGGRGELFATVGLGLPISF